MADEAQSARLLAGLARRIASSLDLQETLQMVVQSVVDQLGFSAAVVNMARPGDVCEVVAVAGSDDATEALMGTRAPMEAWYELLAACEAWGELRFLDHSSDQSSVGPIPSWTPPNAPVDEPGAWHPDDSLFAPLYAPDGTLIGVLSVDEPPGGMLPDAASCRLLEQFAVHAALAIEHARVHTFVADSERLFRAMFDRSPIAIALLTEDQHITRVNVAFEKLLGRASAELVGTVAAELTRPDPVPARRAADGAASSWSQYEIHFTRPDGSEVWGRVSSTLLTVEGGHRTVRPPHPDRGHHDPADHSGALRLRGHPRPAHRPGEPGAGTRPARGGADGIGARPGPGRRVLLRPGSFQGGQRHPRARGRRPAPGRGRPAPRADGQGARHRGQARR